MLYGVLDVAGDLNPFSRSNSARFCQPVLRKDEFWALSDVSFDLKRGDCLALLGHNGAGKTTLLKIINGLFRPDSGEVAVRGRVGALIALGAGFNPILTGRENIHVNASLLGISASETRRSIDDIIDFSGVRAFIDAPVQTYSTGMQVRLGFAIATALKPDVLIVDEVLAVGDSAFRARCFKRIGSLLEQAAVILVSHDMAQVYRLCNRALVLQSGGMAYLGNINEGIECYRRLQQDSMLDESIVLMHEAIVAFSVSHTETDDCRANAVSCEILVECREANTVIGDIILELEFSGQIVCQGRARLFPRILNKGWNRILLTVPRLDLTGGVYQLGINILASHRKYSLVHAKRLCSIHLPGEAGYGCAYDPEVLATLISNQG